MKDTFLIFLFYNIMSNVINELKDLLRKHYVNYNPKKWNNVKSIEEFNKKWGHEHGGYISKEESKEILKLKGKYKSSTLYPKMRFVELNGKKQKALWIPGIISNKKSDQKKYIKIANDLILKNFVDKDTIYIDLNPNSGGKTTVMAAALSPVFNLSKRKRLTYSQQRNNSAKPDLVRTRQGCYKTITNSEVCGTKKKLEDLKYIHIFMGETFSAGEMIAIAFKSLSDQFAIKFHGYRTGGATTSIISYNLSDGGSIEFPGGYMMDVNGKTYKKGVTIK